MGASNCKNDLKENKNEMKIVTLGRHNSGKSSLIYRLKFGDPFKSDMYMGDQAHLLNQDGIKVYAWDYSGRGHYRFDSMFFIRGSSGIIFMIDSASSELFEGALDYLNVILEDEGNANMTLMVVANKQDLDDAVGPEVIEEKIKKNCTIKRGITLFVMPMSATAEDGHSVQLAYRFLFKTIRRKEKGNVQSGLIPHAWERAEKEVEDSETEDDNEENETKVAVKNDNKKTKIGKKKSFFKDPVHMFKSLLIR